MTISDWQWKRRLELYEWTKSKLITAINAAEKEAGSPTIHRAHPLPRWSKHDLACDLAEFEETYHVGAGRDLA